MSLRLHAATAVALALMPAAALAQSAPTAQGTATVARDIPASGTKPLSLDEAKA